MALDIYMIGVIAKNMAKSLEFYRRLGLAIPDDSDGKTHVEVRMGSGLTFFLDSRQIRFDPQYAESPAPEQARSTGSYPFLLEFYVEERPVLEAKYQEMMTAGYESLRAPYDTAFGMRFAFIKDPDGNAILLSAK